MSAELLNKAQREADRDNARGHPRLARASARLAVAVEALFESDGWGGPDQGPRVSQVWEAIEAVVSRADLRSRTAAMLPRVDLPEVILEVMSWAPELAEAFTRVSGGRSRLDDLPVWVAACLAAHAMNIGYRPVAKKGVPALERAWLSHVFQNYVRPETLAAANAPLVAR